MGIHHNHNALVLLQMILLLWAINASEPLNCPIRCGDVDNIEYPFGIGEGCYFDKSFEVVCDTSSGSPIAVLKSINLTMPPELGFNSNGFRIVNVSVIALNGSSSNGEGVNMTGTPFSFSQSENRFIATGCDDSPKPNKQNDSNSGVGCQSSCTCDRALNSDCCDFSCTIFPNTKVLDRNTWYKYFQSTPQECTSVLMVLHSWPFINYRRNELVLKDLKLVPAVLEWAKEKGKCYEEYNSQYSQKCNKDNRCLVQLGSGFYCRCSSGISDFCSGDLLCNTTGGHNCSECPHGYNQFGYNSDRKPLCFPLRNRDSFIISKTSRGKLIVIGCTSGGLGMFILLTGAWRLNKFVKRKREIKLKQKFFKRNGGLLLQKELGSDKGNIEKTKLFTSNELEMATDNFNTNRMLGQGGQGTVYKGMLSDGRIVAVKKSIVIDESKVDEFINEMVILSQINHRNVVKLLGCCLETEVPLLVYEFVHNGTLFHYIHNQQNEEFPSTWEMRLRIAVEVSGVVSYLHSAASIPIYHRDIKSTNILLDEKYRAKVSDFGASRSVAVDQTHMTTKVQGTFGYLDPEYFQSSQLTEKSDVYSFGVVLIELLTGEKPIRSTNSGDDKSLVAYFLDAMKENRLLEIIDPRILEEEDKDQIVSVAKLAKRCLNLKGIKRPTMREVAMELAGIRECKGDSNIVQESLEDTDSDIGDIAGDIETDVLISCTIAVSMGADPLISNHS